MKAGSFFWMLSRAMAACCAFSAAAMDLPLENGWRLASSANLDATGNAISSTSFDDTNWLQTRVPKTVLAALADNGVYPDPYFGLNLQSIPGYRKGMWHVMPEDSPFSSSWWFRKEFHLPQTWRGKHVSLHLEGQNYQANIWLNGQRIADEEAVQGMFRRFCFPITPHLSFDEANVIAIEILPPGRLPDKDYKTKQIQATTGWDDHNPQPPDMNMGIWAPVFLRAHGPVTLAHAYVDSDLALPACESARLTASVVCGNESAQPRSGVLRLHIQDLQTPQRHETQLSQRVDLKAGESQEILFTPAAFPELTLEAPRLWWPHPLGPQDRYAASFRFELDTELSDAAECIFGIRDIQTRMNKEDWREYSVNGAPILIRGGAWMTSDMLLNLSDERYEALVRYAREAGLNMLRSEGFSIRETEKFYSLCDELGVMVTQQIFGRSILDEDLAIACTEDMLLRVRTHPSLAHFLGHDETFPTKKLDSAYRNLIQQHRVHRSYQPHSGTFTVPTRKKTGGTRTGTRELWTYTSPAHYYTQNRRYDVAWGFAQSGGIGGVLAPADSLREMMPAAALWPALHTPAFSFHTVTQGGDYFHAVEAAMNTGYGEAADLNDFCRKIYAMNYASARGMFEAYGRNKYEATGITTWKYNAAWPAAMTWQYIDWYLRPTAAYHGAKKACEPLHIQYAYDDGQVWVINGYRKPRTGLEAEATLYSETLEPLAQWTKPVDVAADGKTAVDPVPLPETGRLFYLVLRLADPVGNLLSQNFYWLSSTPDIPGKSAYTEEDLFYTTPKSAANFQALNTLPITSVEVKTLAAPQKPGEAAFTITNTGPHLAFMIRLALVPWEGGHEIAPVYWSENFFSLLPGETRTIRAAAPALATGENSLRLRLRGWNIEEEFVAP